MEAQLSCDERFFLAVWCNRERLWHLVGRANVFVCLIGDSSYRRSMEQGRSQMPL